jgi:hypothetical protein
VTDLLLRRAQAGRAGAQDDGNYDVIDADGLVIWRIFKATRSPSGTPWMYAGLWGPREPNVDARIYTHSLGAGTERHDEECISLPSPFRSGLRRRHAKRIDCRPARAGDGGLWC